MSQPPPSLHTSEMMAELAQVIGAEAAHMLALRFGGTRLYVPYSIGEHHPISVAIGASAANALAMYAGGSALDIPKQAARREKVRALARGRTLTIAQIAVETSYTERHIYRLLRADRDDRQPGLFDDLT